MTKNRTPQGLASRLQMPTLLLRPSDGQVASVYDPCLWNPLYNLMGVKASKAGKASAHDGPTAQFICRNTMSGGNKNPTSSMLKNLCLPEIQSLIERKLSPSQAHQHYQGLNHLPDVDFHKRPLLVSTSGDSWPHHPILRYQPPLTFKLSVATLISLGSIFLPTPSPLPSDLFTHFSPLFLCENMHLFHLDLFLVSIYFMIMSLYDHTFDFKLTDCHDCPQHLPPSFHCIISS